MPNEGRARKQRPGREVSTRLRARLLTLVVAACFLTVGVQLARLAIDTGDDIVASISEPLARSYARPDLLDRSGRLLATDLRMPSLFADPSLVQDRDEVAEKLTRVLPDLDGADVRRLLEDRTRRFVWLRRGLSPKLAQEVHDLGLPGLEFRFELRRGYPLETLAGHALGYVNIENKGVAGLERYLDEKAGVEAVHGATLSEEAPVRVSLDVGVEHAVDDELTDAVRRYEAKGAAGLVMDVRSGEVLASVSLPGQDPSFPAQAVDPSRVDKIAGGTFELGSVWKIVTIANALDDGRATLDRVVDVTRPLTVGRFTIKDTHPLGRPLTVAEIFVHSSNVGAACLGLEAGPERQMAFLERLGLTRPMRTEAGPVAAPQLPVRLGKVEQITVSYGHGIAVAPLQFAAAVAAIVNGGKAVQPTFLTGNRPPAAEGREVVSAATSASMRELMRRNVTDPAGTGKRADVPGLRVGGKTGTAELPVRGGYAEKSVITSFVAVFPTDAPRYLVLVSLFEPKGTVETKGEILAGLNAAPTAARVIERIAPLLDLAPERTMAER